MGKKLRFALTTSWILFSRTYDAYCTHQLTPDLSKEANPLVTIVGISSWTVLLTIIGLLTLYIIYAYYISLFKPISLLPSEKGYSFSHFVTFVYLGSKSNWTSIFYKVPTNLKRLNHYIGHLLTKFLVYAGIVSTIMWLFINYTTFYKSIHSPALIYSILIIGCIIIAYIWNKSLYRIYLNSY